MATAVDIDGSSAGGGAAVTAAWQTLLAQSRELRMSGRIGEAVRLLVDHLRNADELHAAQVAIYRELAEAHLRGGRWDDAIRACDDALALVDESDGRARGPLNERKAWALFRKGRVREAFALASPLEPELDDPQSRAGLHNTLGGIAWQGGKCVEAFGHVSRAAAYYEEAGDRFGAAGAHTNLGVLAYAQGRWSTAEQHFAASEKIRAEIGCIAGRAVNLLNIGVLRMSMGDHAQARVNLEQALTLARDAGEPFDANRAEIALAHLDLIEERLEDATRHLDSVLDRRDCVCEDDIVQASWLRALVSGDVEMAKEARKVAREHELVESEADCCRALASVYCRSNQLDVATEMLDEAVRLSSEANDPYRRGLALLERGIVRRDRAQVDEAARVFEQLGARYDLERAEAARASI